MLTLKYQQEFSQLACRCPAERCVPLEAPAPLFRFARENLADPDNYRPNAVVHPQRKFKDDTDRCENYALSFYDTAQSAATKHRSLMARHPNLRHKIGDRLVSVLLTGNDGVVSPPDHEQHRDVYEAANADFDQRATLIQVLP